MQAHELNTNLIFTGARQHATSMQKKNSSLSFENILSEQYHQTMGTDSRIASSSRKSKQNAKLLALGKISSQNPTVSDLLVQHPVYGKKCWSIIHSPKNNNKLFNHIQAGETIFMDPETFELSWKNEKRAIPSVQTALYPDVSSRQFTDHIQLARPIRDSVAEGTTIKSLGIISRNRPTISSLLIKHPKYAAKCWQIIHSKVNQDKPFDKLKPGTRILINTNTFELTWEKDRFTNEVSTASLHQTPVPSLSSKKNVQGETLSDQLESAVRSFVGKPYVELDCYELVVQGLQQVGIQYSGKNGLKEILVKKALGDGLPLNSYLTGDGLIHTAGKHLFSKTITHPAGSNITAQSLLKEMGPYLNKGIILSFSTPTRGHMGIISNQNQMWTFINSGTMDHPINSRINERHISKGVGEERLLPEIRNWLRLANRRNEPLRISLGRISKKRLLAENLTPTRLI